MPTGIYPHKKNQGFQTDNNIRNTGKTRIKKGQALFKGRHHTEETKKKISYARKINKGKNHNSWTGGSEAYRKQRVLERDNYTCQCCGMRDEEIMSVDHIKPKSIYPELTKEMENMQALCPNCHARKTIRERKEIWRIRKLRKVQWL